jgi:ADP-ribosyl-[dinitrogen reductase] hydrolase
MDDTNIQGRLNGCAVGAAVGDALGMPLEFGSMRPENNLVRQMLPGRLPSGCFTDDTEMALAVAESLIVHQPLDADDLVKRFLRWLRSSPSDVGMHVSKVLGWITAGTSWQDTAERVRKEMPSTAGNGSVMRCWPVAVAEWPNREQIVIDSKLQSMVTHPNPDCLAGSAFINWMIAELFDGSTLQTAYQSAMENIELSTEFRQLLEGAPNCGREGLKNSGWVRHTLQSAVWALLSTDNFEDALVAVVNLGGDADTAGTVVGAVAGAAYGLQAIPDQWRSRIYGEWPLGTGRYYREENIIHLVSRLRGSNK